MARTQPLKRRAGTLERVGEGGRRDAVGADSLRTCVLD